jgi:hypothetical protein
VFVWYSSFKRFFKGFESEALYIKAILHCRAVSNVLRVASEKLIYTPVYFGRHDEWTIRGDSNDGVEPIVFSALVVSLKDIIFRANE